MERLDDCVCIFDLDGTLVDSAPDLAAALNRLLFRQGLQVMDPAVVRPFVGEGARALIRRAYAAQAKPPLDIAEEDALVAAYIEDYASHICEESFAFDGVGAALQKLKSLGAKLAVCTNKTERLAHPLLDALDLSQHFGMVIAADTLAEKKPSALPLQHIMRETLRRRAVMVGDTFTDQAAADAAGLPALIASFGYGRDDERLASAHWFHDYTDLTPLIVEKLGVS